MASGGWSGLSGGHGRRGARRNRALPILSCTPPPMASREAEPPSGGHRRPPGGSESLRKILTMPLQGRRANSTVSPPCPGIGLCLLATVPARAGHGGTGSPPPCGGIVRILRRLSEPAGGRREASGGWLGLSGGHGRRGARRNRALPDGIGLCPLATVHARAGNRGTVELATPLWGASSEFYEGSPSRRETVRWPPEGGAASLEAMGGGVHDGIGALPDGIGLYPLATVPARAGHGGGHGGIGSPPVRGHRQNFTKALRAVGSPCGGLRRVARPLWRPWAAGCTTE